MYVLLDEEIGGKRSVLGRSNYPYKVANGQALLEIDPSEWPKLTFLSLNIDIDRKQDVRYDVATETFELVPGREKSIVDGIAFYGFKELEHRYKNQMNERLSDLRSKLTYTGNVSTDLSNFETEVQKELDNVSTRLIRAELPK